MSMAGLMHALDQFFKSSANTSPGLASPARHEESFYVSRLYNWKSGKYRDAYTYGATYKSHLEFKSGSKNHEQPKPP